MDRADIEDLKQAFVEAMREVGGGFGGSSGGGVGGSTGSSAGSGRTFDLDKILKSLDKSIKETNRDLKEMNQALEQFDDAINEAERMGDVFKKSALEAKRDQIAKEKNRKEQEEQTAELAKKTRAYGDAFGKIGAPLTAAIGKMSSDLLSSSNTSTQFASSVGNMVIDSGGAVVKGIGRLLTKSNVPVLGALGEATTIVAETATKGAKFANEVLAKELEKTIKAFNSASAAGAVFSDGLEGLRNAATGTRLTVVEFANVIKTQSKVLAESGQGVTEGTKQLGRVGAIFDKDGGKIRRSLQNLGFSFEEHAELSATVIANMRRSVGGKVSDAEVATETQKYAANLRLLSQLTGEDAKAKAEKVKQENTDLAFQLQLQGMSKEQRNEVNLAMAAMTEQEKKNLKDRMVYGVVVNKDGAIMEAMSRTSRITGEHQFNLLKKNNLTAEEVLKHRQIMAKDVILESKEFKAFALAAHHGVDAAKGAAQALAEKLRASTDLSDTDIQQVIADLQKSMAGGNKLTDDVMGAADAHQALKVSIQDQLLPVLGIYASLTKDINEGLKDLLKTLGFKTSEEKEVEKAAKEKKEKRIEQFRNVDGMDWERRRENLYKQSKEGGQGSFSEWQQYFTRQGKYSRDAFVDYKNSIGLESSADREASKHATISKAPVTPGEGRARGGVSSGPLSGYYELLHGTEAVVPLPDGKSIPARIEQPTSSNKSQDEQLNLMRQFVQKAEELIRITADHKDVSQSILQNTY